MTISQAYSTLSICSPRPQHLEKYFLLETLAQLDFGILLGMFLIEIPGWLWKYHLDYMKLVIEGGRYWLLVNLTLIWFDKVGVKKRVHLRRKILKNLQSSYSRLGPVLPSYRNQSIDFRFN